MSIHDGPRGSTSISSEDVPVVAWPAGAAARARLHAVRRPRVLAVRATDPPPEITDDLEDWIRMPVDGEELELRQRTLLDRWLAGRGGVWLDEHGLVHGPRHWVALSRTQAAAAAPLIAGLGRVVARDDVRRSYEAVAGHRTDEAFRSLLSRLRHKLGQVGGTLHMLSGGRLLLEVTVHSDASESKSVGNNYMEV
jgi:hypothetical protein